MNPLVCFNRHALFLDLKRGSHFCLLCDIYIYLESACIDEQNSGQRFNLRARIAKLWQFKPQKVEKLHEDDCLAIFKPGLWQTNFSDAVKNGTIFSGS